MLLQSSEQIEAFLRQQVALLDSVAKQGIRLDLAVDEINVAVGRDGTLYKVNAGRKRTMAAKLLGVGVIPVRVTQVHPIWIASHSAPETLPKSQALIRALDALRDIHGQPPVGPGDPTPDRKEDKMFPADQAKSVSSDP